MSDNTLSSEEILHNNENETLGSILKSHRESLNMSQEDIAKKLNLRVSIVRALEADNHDIDVPQIYISGYINNYLRAINLPKTAVQDHLDTLKINKNSPRSKQIEPNFQIDDAPNKPKKFWLFSIFGSIIALVITGIFIEYNQEQNLSAHPQQNELSNTVTAVAPIHNEAVETILDSPNDQSDNPQTIQFSSPETEKTPVHSSIQLSFEQPSWVRIDDNFGKTLVFGMKEPGEVVEAKGPSPFKVILGNAQHVSVLLDEKNLDIEPYINKGVANFTTPEQITN